jgi:hypothetical protein
MSCLKPINRHEKSTQDCTWARIRGSITTIDKDQPGPGQYNVTPQPRLNVADSQKPGYAFPIGPKDSINSAVSKNKNPGPGAHNLQSKLKMESGQTKSMGLPTKECKNCHKHFRQGVDYDEHCKNYCKQPD